MKAQHILFLTHPDAVFTVSAMLGLLLKMMSVLRTGYSQGMLGICPPWAGLL